MKNRLTEIRQARRMTLEQVAAATGSGRGQIWKLENGKVQLTPRWLARLAKALDCQPLDILSDKPQGAPAPARALPVIDQVQAGDWTAPGGTDANGDGLGHVFPATPVGPRAFALEIRGDSMAPEFHPGDRVIVDPDLAPLPGDYVVAKLHDEHEATFKKFRPRPGAGKDKTGTIELVPLNPDWPVLTIGRDRPGKIVATMVEHHRYRRR